MKNVDLKGLTDVTKFNCGKETYDPRGWGFNHWERQTDPMPQTRINWSITTPNILAGLQKYSFYF